MCCGYILFLIQLIYSSFNTIYYVHWMWKIMFQCLWSFLFFSVWNLASFWSWGCWLGIVVFSSESKHMIRWMFIQTVILKPGSGQFIKWLPKWSCIDQFWQSIQTIESLNNFPIFPYLYGVFLLHIQSWRKPE